jgi:hypothetical protein
VKVNGPDVVLLSLVSFSAQQTLIFPVISTSTFIHPSTFYFTEKAALRQQIARYGL